MDEKSLSKKKVADLRIIALTLGIENGEKYKKTDLINRILTEAITGTEEDKSIEKSDEIAEEITKTPIQRRVGKPATRNRKEDVNKKESSFDNKEENVSTKSNNKEEYVSRKSESKEYRNIKQERHRDLQTSNDDNGIKDTLQEEKHIVELRQVEGVLELAENGFGFLRFDNFMSSDADIYVSPAIIKKFRLKTGDKIKGKVKEAKKGDKFGSLVGAELVNGVDPYQIRNRKSFEDLTPIFPTERFVLEKNSRQLAMRMIDLVAPIGKGQRGIIVAPPKAGKTTLLKEIATRIEEENREVELIVLLIDERPEEVTDMKRSLRGSGEVIYSTFDEQPQNHVKAAEMVMARAQRLAEQGKDVVILLDSITRLARAYNLVLPSSGRTLSGGFDPGALHKPKKFFGTARNIEEGGSVTILATALVETGSRMDEVIYEEFKGTGNMELHLDRKLSEKRLFPAINLNKSGTRKEDLLMTKEEQEAIWHMRKTLGDGTNQDAVETIIAHLAHTRSNKEFVEIVKKIKI